MVHEISRDKKVVQLTDLSTLPVQLVKVVTVMITVTVYCNSKSEQIPSIDVISQEQQSELSALSDDTNDQNKILVCLAL